MPGRPILRDAFAGGMVFGAALVGALGGSLVLRLEAVVSIANWECLAGRTTGWSCLFTELGPMLCGLGLVPPSIGLIARWWAARQR